MARLFPPLGGKARPCLDRKSSLLVRLSEVVEKAECGVLLDVNNLCVSSENHGFDPYEFLNQIPPHPIASPTFTMKPSKPTSSAKNTSPVLPRKLESRTESRELQRLTAGVLFRPLTSGWGMQERRTDGTPMDELAARFIKPNGRLTWSERLEIFNRHCWFRVLDCLHDDYPGLRLLGEWSSLGWICRPPSNHV